MKTAIATTFLIIMLLLSLLLNGQNRQDLKNSISISMPVIFSTSEATVYGLGSRLLPDGKATSYGLNVNYSHSIYKGCYGKIGLGYFKQNFDIRRPFKYDSPVQILFSTQSYSYDNVHIIGEFGYLKRLKKNLSLAGSVSYNVFYSFKQEYRMGTVSQINPNRFSIGEMINLGTGVNMDISKKVSFAGNFLLPIFTHWNEDEMFFYLGYSKDEQQIARNKFSIGFTISWQYNF